MKAWLEASGLSFALKPIGETATLLDEIGFRNIETEDRNAWYVRHAREDLERLESGLADSLADIIGPDAAADWLWRSKKRALVAAQGHLRPGHIRAQN